MSDNPGTPSDDTKAMHQHAEEQVRDLERRLTEVERGLHQQNETTPDVSSGEVRPEQTPGE